MVGFVFTGGGRAGQGPTSQSGGSLSQKQGGIDPKDTGPSWLGPGGGNGNLLQYSCWENPMDRRVCQAIVHEVSKSWTRLRN